jgi:hypothetical protein
VRLITAHRILIAAGIAFFLFYAILQVRRFLPTGDPVAVVQAVVSAGVAVGLALYYRTLSRWNGRS